MCAHQHSASFSFSFHGRKVYSYDFIFTYRDCSFKRTFFILLCTLLRTQLQWKLYSMCVCLCMCVFLLRVFAFCFSFISPIFFVLFRATLISLLCGLCPPEAATSLKICAVRIFVGFCFRFVLCVYFCFIRLTQPFLCFSAIICFCRHF